MQILNKQTSNKTRRGFRLQLFMVAGTAFFAFFNCANCSALESNDVASMLSIYNMDFHDQKVSNDFQVRGWKLDSTMYVGHAKIGGEWGVGLVVDKGDYLYGINEKRVSIIKRF
ncbi:MAG: hypothetical protein ACE5EH_13090 [Gammaproteobacteria bacterium]